jgi:glycerol-3-phosphate acyltransferase PlsY
MLVILFSYLLGSIPFSLIVGKLFFKKDIRNYGSGNLGATNVGRVINKKVGVLVLLLDVAKAVLAVLISYFAVRGQYDDITPFIYLSGIMAIIGHCYPIFASFKGGKAVACTYGFLLITNIYIFLIALVVFALTLAIKKIVSLSSLTSFIAASLVAFFPIFHHSPLLNIELNYFYPVVLLLITSFVFYRHRSNIKRIIAGKEQKMNFFKKKEPINKE